MADEMLRRNLDDAFATPHDLPNPRLVSRTMAAILAGEASTVERGARGTRGFGLSIARAVAAVTLAALSIAAVGVFLALHRNPVQVAPIKPPVIFPTKMVSSTTGWAVTARGSAQQVWRTTNAGTSWTDVTPPSSADPAGYSYTNYFLDASRAWVTEAVAARAASPYLVTYRTVDGGRSWQRGAPLNVGIDSMPPSDEFIDVSSGWLLLTNGDLAKAAWPDLYATVDGGMHWNLVASQAGADQPVGNLRAGAADVSFVTTSTGWLTVGLYAPTGNGGATFARSIVLVTHDGGRTWRPQPLPVELPDGIVAGAPVFFGRQQGIMVLQPIDPASSGKSVLLSTANGGLSWTARTLDWPYIDSIQFIDRQHGWALAGPGPDFMKSATGATVALPLYRTDDGGVTWVRVPTSLDLVNGRDRVTDIRFVDSRTGFATVWNDTGPTQLLRSGDGGLTWTAVTTCRSALGNSYPSPVCPAKT